MNKKAAMALFLLLIPTATAIAPSILAGLAGIGIIGALTGVVIWQQEQIAGLEKLNEIYKDALNQSFNDAVEMGNYTFNTDIKDFESTALILQDGVEFGKPYAYIIGKYAALKTLDEELNNGTDFSTALIAAKQEAMTSVKDYYLKQANNAIAKYNAKMLRFKATVQTWLEAARIQSAANGNIEVIGYTFDNDGTTVIIKADANGAPYYITTDGSNVCMASVPSLEDATVLYNLSKMLSNMSVTVNYYGIKAVDGTITCGYTPKVFATPLASTLDEIDAEYKQVVDNLDVYLDGLTSDIVSSANISDFIDPITLATQINNDYDLTGYYGYAAAELALLGLKLTGLNKTTTIDVNGTTLSGILFTDWEGTLEKNQTYYADPACFWYFVDENGQLYSLKGYNFTVVDLRDKDGNELQNTTFVKYVDHSGDIQKIYDEFAKLNELYSEYLAMQAVSGGGSSELGDWWNSLSDTEKLVLAGAAVLFIVLIARR